MAKFISGNVAGIDFDAQLVLSDAHLRTLVGRLETIESCALDLETTGYEGQKDYGPASGEIRLAQIAWRDEGDLNVAVIDGQATDLKILRPFLESNVTKFVHYSPFEREWIGHHLECKLGGVVDTCYLGQSINKKLRGEVALLLTDDQDDFVSLQRDLMNVADAYSLIGREITILEVKAAFDKVDIPIKGWKLSERATLQAMVKRYLGHDISKEGQTSDWSGYLTDDQLIYAAGDAVVTLELAGPVTEVANQLDVYGKMQWRVGNDLRHASHK